MSEAQKDQFCLILTALKSMTNILHHGGAIGADTEAVDLAVTLSYTPVEHLPHGDPLQRNHVIVENSDILIAAPQEDGEILRSGTWATVRYARKAGKPIIMLSRR